MELPRTTKLSSLLRRAALFVTVVGPGLITGALDNDAGGITTYSMTGAYFGYSMLWLFIPLTVACIVILEMNGRMAVVTGKGLSDLIRENYGVKATFYMMIVLLIANWSVTVSDFCGVAASLELFRVPRWVSVPLSAAFVWWFITKGTYKAVEKVFLIGILFFGCYVIAAFLATPPWKKVLMKLVDPSSFQWTPAYTVVVISNIGTTLTPWMLFYLQSSTVDKGLKKADYPFVRWDIILGCVVTEVIAFFIMVTCAATLNTHGIHVKTAEEAALALAPFAGKNAIVLFGAGLFMASLITVAILPLTTAYYICEGLGWEAGLDRSPEEAPQFYTLYGVMILAGAAVVLIPKLPLFLVILATQVVNGVLLPFVLIFMIRLVNKRAIMGDFVNSSGYNLVAWTTVGVLIALTLLTVASTFF